MKDDLRFALRLFRRSPGFMLVACGVLALAIGVNTAVFGIVQSILFRPLAFPESDRLAVVWQSNAQKGWQKYEVASGNYFD